jgi:dienelactone hydrolase
MLAVRLGSDLAAAVPFYGIQPGAAKTPPRLSRRCSPITRELDTRITSGWPAFDTALTAAHMPHEGYVYARAPITASTTTRRPVTTKPPPSSPGSARSIGSTNI